MATEARADTAMQTKQKETKAPKEKLATGKTVSSKEPRPLKNGHSKDKKDKPEESKNGHSKEKAKEPNAAEKKVVSKKRARDDGDEEKGQKSSAVSSAKRAAMDKDGADDDDRTVTVHPDSKDAPKKSTGKASKPKSKPRGLLFAIPNGCVRQSLLPFTAGQDAINLLKNAIIRRAVETVARSGVLAYDERHGVPCSHRIDPRHHAAECTRPPFSSDVLTIQS